MIRFSVLASSSKGNASVIEGGSTHLMVDAGISALRLRRGLSACGLTVAGLDGIFFTHEHADHTCGLGTLSKKNSLPLYCTRYTGQDLRGIAPNARFTYVEPGVAVQVGDIKVTPFSVSHDALAPVGYLFECGGSRLGYVTDTGCIPRGMDSLLAGVDALYLESNYDPAMLRRSNRPLSLIERIESNWGHLSNAQAGQFIRQIAHPGLKHLVLAHLSQDCNTPDIARAAMQQTLDALHLPTRLCCAPAATQMPWIEVP